MPTCEQCKKLVNEINSTAGINKKICLSCFIYNKEKQPFSDQHKKEFYDYIYKQEMG